MSDLWILVANAAEAKILAGFKAKLINGSENGDGLVEIEHFKHPASRQKSADLSSDKPGNFSGSAHGTMVESSDQKAIEAEAFAKTLIVKLEDGQLNKHYNELIVVASPNFHGVLNKHWPETVKKCIVCQIEKDYTQVLPRQLVSHLANYL